MKKYDLLILGAGPAGLTAAIYGSRAGLSVLVLEPEGPGGQIKLTEAVENWPGTLSINGFDLGENFAAHAREAGAEFLSASAEKIFSENGRRWVESSAGPIEAGAIIIATGAGFRRLGLAGEEAYTGRGVSYCAVCDGPFYRGREVAVIGGGNTALQEALYLTRFAQRVYLVHRRQQFRAGQALVNRVRANERIELKLSMSPTAIEGDEQGVTALRLRDLNDSSESRLAVDGVFVFVGTEPRCAFAEGYLHTAEGGWIVTDKRLATSRPGIFAAGDVRDTDLRQVVTAAADGARAAMSAYEFLAEA